MLVASLLLVGLAACVSTTEGSAGDRRFTGAYGGISGGGAFGR